MSYKGKKSTKNKTKNKSLKNNTISFLKELLSNGESELQELLHQIHVYYDELIDDVKRERQNAIDQLSKTFSMRSSQIQDCIASNESAQIEDSARHELPLFPDCYFKLTRNPTTELLGNYILQHIFLTDNEVSTSVALSGDCPMDFVRVKKRVFDYFYLSTNPLQVYRSQEPDLSSSRPVTLLKNVETKREKKRKGKSQTKHNNSGVSVHSWKHENNWGPETMSEEDFVNAADWTGTSDKWDQTNEWDQRDQCNQSDQWGQPDNWDQPDQCNQSDQWGQPDNWDQPDEWNQVDQSDQADQWESTTATPFQPNLDVGKYSKWTKMPFSFEVPFDFTISHSNSVFLTYPAYGSIGVSRLTHKNSKLEKIECFSHTSILQPKGICILDGCSTTLVAMADAECCKIQAVQLTDLLANTTGTATRLWEYEFSLCLALTESPMLLYDKHETREFLILTKSNSIFTASYGGNIIRKLILNELTSPYDMKHVSDEDIIIIADLESLVVIHGRGKCVTKYFSDRFSRGGCILETKKDNVTFLSPASWSKSSIESVNVPIETI